MLSTYLLLGNACLDVPGLKWVDLDKGQLDNPDKFNSLIPPALLIGQTDLTWSQLAGRNQLGKGTVTTKTVLTLPTATHISHPTAQDNLAKLTIADRVRATILSVPGVMSRLTTREYSSGSFFVVEETFEVAFKSGPSYNYVSLTPHVTAFMSTSTNPPTA
ncbi:hypothetical protein ACAW74_25760 [Fibrella sp. WM1]|uniref:hypothetical protein n=1 Tax=Fibrella musci TaxID=3242485 RepID=UPI00352078A0